MTLECSEFLGKDWIIKPSLFAEVIHQQEQISCWNIWTQLLQHDSRNNVKHSWKYTHALAGYRSRAAQYKTNALTTKPKSQLSEAVVRDWLYSRSYAKSTVYRYIRWGCLRITQLLFVWDLHCSSLHSCMVNDIFASIFSDCRFWFVKLLQS